MNGYVNFVYYVRGRDVRGMRNLGLVGVFVVDVDLNTNRYRVGVSKIHKNDLNKFGVMDKGLSLHIAKIRVQESDWFDANTDLILNPASFQNVFDSRILPRIRRIMNPRKNRVTGNTTQSGNYRRVMHNGIGAVRSRIANS